MAHPRSNLTSALASIFLPRDSIYAELDQDIPEEAEGEEGEEGVASQSYRSSARQASPPRQHTHDQEHENGEEVEGGGRTVERYDLPATEYADAFSTLSPPTDTSLTNPARRPAAPGLPLPPSESLSDSRSPFYEEPIDSTYTSPVGGASVLASPPSSSRARRPRLASRSPSTERRRKLLGLVSNHNTVAGGSNGNAGSAMLGSSEIGSTSLMGLLGGTRFEGGFGASANLGLGLMRDTVLEEEEGEGASGRGRNANSPRRFNEREEMMLSQLPPPPSEVAYEEEEEEDAPPDFTSRVPLMSLSGTPRSHQHRQRRPPLSSTSSGGGVTSPPVSRWTGLHLGGELAARKNVGLNPKEKALWRWINVEDLDDFLQEVYLYYVGKGIWVIGLTNLLNLLTVGWVIAFSTFLLGCIDYSILWESHRLEDVVVDHCINRFSGLTLVLFISFTIFYVYRVITFGLGVKKLWHMHEFFSELLEIPENDIQTIPWNSLVSRLSVLRSTHPCALSSSSHRATSESTKPTLDAHDVANRIMREENYLVSLFNQELLDLSTPLPDFVRTWAPRLSNRFGGQGTLTRTLEWNLKYCLMGFLFGKDGQVRKCFLGQVGQRNRVELVEALKRRFILMGLVNAAFAPFIVLYLLMYSFFRYFDEYHRNPSSIGSRQFTQYARWKFREYNELPHLFQQRLNEARPLADQYVSQFPKAKTALLSRFVAFLAGSFAGVLVLFSLIDPDAFLHFEVTPGRTVLFYIGIFGSVLAVARGMVPDENKVVDAEGLMRAIIVHTHHSPVEWRGKLHSAEVHESFSQLYQMKTSLFVQELLSVLVTPFVLWYSLPKSAGPVIDFFRDFSVHVDGLGYVCSFALFNFKRHGDAKFGAPVQVQEDRWKSKQGKMEKSFLNFTSQNPAWVPRDLTQSQFLSNMTERIGHPGGAAHPPHLADPLYSPSARHARHLEPRATSRGPYFAPRGLATTLTTEDIEIPRRVRHELDASPSSAVRQRRLDPASSPPTLSSRGDEAPIQEESGLDDDAYVTTSKRQPFGASVAYDEEGELAPETQHGGDGPEGGSIPGLGALFEGRRW